MNTSTNPVENEKQLQLQRLTTCTNTILENLPKLLSQQPLPSSIALMQVVNNCHQLLLLIQELKRQTLFRHIQVEGMRESAVSEQERNTSDKDSSGVAEPKDPNIFYSRTREWMSLADDQLDQKLLIRGLGW